MTDPSESFFKKHRELAFVLQAFAVIFLILFIKTYLSGLLRTFIILFPVLFLIYIRLQSVTSDKTALELLTQHITFLPVMYTEGERRDEGVAWITYSIILLNIIVFYVIQMNSFLNQDFIITNLIFLPYEINFWNIPVSAVTSMFLHGSTGHLWGNMIFLWAVGTVVEKRVGAGRFMLFYLVTGLLAGLTFIGIEFVFMGKVGHVLGASGAVSGIMGVYAIRCYFKSMVFPIPILGIFSLILPIGLKVRLNALVILGLFFLMDLGSGLDQVAGVQSGIAHWAHIGGMSFGMLFAALTGLGAEAVDERHLDIGLAASEKKGNAFEGEESLEIILKKDPNNAEALLHLARIKSEYSAGPEAIPLYQQAIAVYIRTKPALAADIFIEYYGKYLKGVSPDLQLRIAGILYRSGNYDISSRCLEMLCSSAETPPQIKERAMYQCAVVLETMGLLEASREYYKMFVDNFPNSQAVEKARAKLA